MSSHDPDGSVPDDATAPPQTRGFHDAPSSPVSSDTDATAGSPWRAPDRPGRVRVTPDPASPPLQTGPPTPATPPPGAPAANGAPRPLAPPTGWNAGNAGPGSPAGSVRPPDTTGTVAAPAATKPRRGRGVVVFLAALLGAGVGTVGTLAASDALSPQPAAETAEAQPVQAPTVEVQGDDPGIVSTVAAAVTPSVVRIDILGGSAGAEEELGLGSGVIYSSDGLIITNNHVVEVADALRVKLASGEEFTAELIGTDPLSDLAVVKIDTSGLPAISLREDSPAVGETAIAIGSPFGLDASVTAGVISAVGRDITVPGDEQVQVVPAVIQTDAAINPGNSGGALVDQQGRLLGINTAILSGSGGSQGVGFAIPTAQVIATAEQLIETGEVRHALLGVSGVDVTSAIATRLELDEDQGAMVSVVSPDSGASEAGIRVDDVIIRLGDRDVRTVTDLVAAVRSHRPDETVEVVYVRNGEEQTVDVVLGELDE